MAWDTAAPVKVWFGSSSDFDQARNVHGDSEYLTSGDAAIDWTEDEILAFAYVLYLYQSVCGLTFELIDPEIEGVAEAYIVWWKTDLGDDVLGVHEMPQASQRWGYFNPNTESWKNMHFGGDGLNTVIHELGHGMGLAHPHDGGDREDGTTFPGVTDSSPTGTYGLNQGIWTVMSYNSGWDRTGYDLAYGNQGGLGAFDIAALQALYGKNLTTATGNDVYTLPSFSLYTGIQGWFCIWDAGGQDTISAVKAVSSVEIDLRAATLSDNDPNAGGFVSREAGVAGGFTIANGVTIENAHGGSYNDRLYGNSVANMLKGNGGADTLLGNSGNDVLWGGSGNDRLYGGSGSDVFVFNTKTSKTSNVDRIYDFNPQYDAIQLDNAVFTKLGSGSASSPRKFKTDMFVKSTKAKDREDRIVYDKGTGALYYDADGSGSKAQVKIATLAKSLKLTYHDFFVI
ncbi:serralysin [Microvirga flocculans]|uniref:Serralysin n=1 Tax=Microvirga flocculans TaxID=217168 RepID=A0A7W6IEX8_9HYPH|nr:M10 family metallopeptidase C-terminal domain-containing protein [Microvirga flocculans]MBB4040212.1 serralysin [Microvirga flocculans]